MDLTMTEPGPLRFAGRTGRAAAKIQRDQTFQQQRARGDDGALGDVPAPAGLCRETGDDGYDSFDESAADCFELAGVHAGAERKSWSQAGSRGWRESVAQSR